MLGGSSARPPPWSAAVGARAPGRRQAGMAGECPRGRGRARGRAGPGRGPDAPVCSQEPEAAAARWSATTCSGASRKSRGPWTRTWRKVSSARTWRAGPASVRAQGHRACERGASRGRGCRPRWAQLREAPRDGGSHRKPPSPRSRRGRDAARGRVV